LSSSARALQSQEGSDDRCELTLNNRLDVAGRGRLRQSLELSAILLGLALHLLALSSASLPTGFTAQPEKILLVYVLDARQRCSVRVGPVAAGIVQGVE
jgi:hypothetical protein